MDDRRDLVRVEQAGRSEDSWNTATHLSNPTGHASRVDNHLVHDHAATGYRVVWVERAHSWVLGRIMVNVITSRVCPPRNHVPGS